MKNSKTKIRFYTIADYEQEEIWLNEQHKRGWKLKKMILPCFYVFESCTPEDVVYRLDFKNGEASYDYFKLFEDYGWEHFAQIAGWSYFRKPVSQIEGDGEGEIFSDDASRVELVNRIVKRRMLPLLSLFFCCVLPNLTRLLLHREPEVLSLVLTIVFSVLTCIYLFLFIHCGFKLGKLKEKYTRD